MSNPRAQEKEILNCQKDGAGGGRAGVVLVLSFTTENLPPFIEQNTMLKQQHGKQVPERIKEKPKLSAVIETSNILLSKQFKEKKRLSLSSLGLWVFFLKKILFRKVVCLFCLSVSFRSPNPPHLPPHPTFSVLLKN
jgi:hypothetical protein